MPNTTVEVVGMDDVLAHIPSAPKRQIVINRLLQRVAVLYTAAMKRAYIAAGIHNRTGAGLASIRAVIDVAAQTVAVGSKLKYMKWLDTGTGIYGPRGKPIVPLNHTYLRFPGMGQARATGSMSAGSVGGWVFTKSVKGMKPRPYIEKGLKDGEVGMVALMDKAGREMTSLTSGAL